MTNVVIAGGAVVAEGLVGTEFTPGSGFTFDAGDTITVELVVVGGAIGALDNVDINFADANASGTFYQENPNSGSQIGLAAGSTRVVTVTADTAVAAQTDVILAVAYGVAVNGVRVTVLGCISSSATAASQSQILAQAAITQTAGLVFGRTRDLVTPPPNVRAQAAVADAGVLNLSAGRGAAGQGADQRIGVWGDFTWTGLENDSAVVDSNTDAFAIAGGVDAEIAPGIIFGAALSLSYADSEAANGLVESDETGVGITPYVAYQIDDRFALQGLVGYGYGAGDTKRTGASGEYDAHRYYAAVEASAFESWGDAAVFASVGVLWGQSHRLSYTESDGTVVKSDRSRIGTASLLAQPSYLFTLDANDGVFIEPFATVEYSYDFNITKISGATNDRDAIRIGAGANLFAGDSLSGAIEATRMLGREDQDETSVRATVRADF